MSFKIFGVVHLLAMPGDLDPRPWDKVLGSAIADAEALVSGGVDGLIIENFGSAPFWKGTVDDPVPAHQIAMLARTALAISKLVDVPIGVNCLRNDVMGALGIAAACELAFVRVNIHTGAYVTDQGLIEGTAAKSLRYRETLKATNIGIWADVMVKHATPLAPLTMSQAVADCAKRGRADAIIVSGSGTGSPTSVEDLTAAKNAAGEVPVYIGSGLTPDTAESLVPLCDGAIVGTYFKEEGDVANVVSEPRVQHLVDLVKSF